MSANPIEMNSAPTGNFQDIIIPFPEVKHTNLTFCNLDGQSPGTGGNAD
jgi:hypothetical protein